MRCFAREHWLGLLAWLDADCPSGILTRSLFQTFGPIAALLPLVRQVAASLSPWLLSVLADRQRRGWAAQALPWYQQEADLLVADSLQQPCRRQEARYSAAWLAWLIGAEAARLVRLLEAPDTLLRRPGWLVWDVRFWALAVCLARIGQLYRLLEQRQGREAATEALIEHLVLAWSQATSATTAA